MKKVHAQDRLHKSASAHDYQLMHVMLLMM